MGFDFDGTLAPIVARPEDARLDPALRPLLDTLLERVGRVAVVSGRHREFLEDRVPGLLPIGSYGLELPGELSDTGLPPGFPADDVRARLASARAELERAAADGARVEVKPWGLALHYRGATSQFDEGRAWDLVSQVADHNRLAVQRGRLVFELKPREAVDKGWAMKLLVERFQPSAATFTGDDLGDTPAWKALSELALPTLAAGIASPELPAEALEECDLVLESRDELISFVEALIEAAGSRPG